ncbi:MAG: tyrosine-type recombinase/integrase [Campylobacterota bacterium]|nr:tyrosine-type recombinase/integrase [Campylobacterota bacterium]
MIKMTQPKIYTRGVKLWVRFSLNGEVIKQSLNIEDSKANRKLATTQIIPQMLLKVHSGEFFENKIVPTVKEMIYKSLEIHQGSRKLVTQTQQKANYEKHIIPVFGNRKLDTIKASELAIWQNKLLLKLAPKTVSVLRVIFYTVFDDALRDELINKNPFIIVKAPSNQPIKKINPFTKDEIYKILPKIKLSMRCYFAIGFFTGMRSGEIMALRISDIDMKNKIIKVTKSRNNKVESAPKTKNSIREVDIIDALVPYLEEHLKLYPTNDYLFKSNRDKAFDYSSQISTTYWVTALKDLNFEYRNMHQMRHTFASLMIASGEDILWVSSMLGHKNSSITLSVYAKYTRNTKKIRGTFLLEN